MTCDISSEITLRVSAAHRILKNNLIEKTKYKTKHKKKTFNIKNANESARQNSDSEDSLPQVIIIIGNLYSAHVLCSRRFTIIDFSI